MMRSDIEFAGHAGVTLRGWLYVPEGEGPFPAVVMTHGLSAVKEQRLDAYAELFCRSGFVVVVYDHRNLGTSDGEPRQLVNPWAQTRDMRLAVDWLCTRPVVDTERIGLWGSSFSGGEVVVLAAIDPRIRAAVAHVPFVGYGIDAATAPGALEAYRAVIGDRTGRGLADVGEVAGPLTLIDDGTGEALFPDPAATAFFGGRDGAATWRNTVSVQSAFTDEPPWNPGQVVGDVTAALLVVVATGDAAAPPQAAIDALARAKGPTRLVTLDCGHFDAYVGENFRQATTAMLEFLGEHLGS